MKNTLDLWERKLKSLDSGVVLKNTSNTMLKEKYQNGNFIFAYYKADREFQVEEYKNIEKIKLISKSDSKQFFIIINQPQENNKEEICIDQLNEKYLKIKEGLLRCGNIVTNVNNEKETKEIIRNYIFLNDDENRM